MIPFSFQYSCWVSFVVRHITARPFLFLGPRQSCWCTRKKRSPFGGSWSYLARASACTYSRCMCHLNYCFHLSRYQGCSFIIGCLLRLVNGYMRRWQASYQRIKLRKFTMVRGQIMLCYVDILLLTRLYVILFVLTTISLKTKFQKKWTWAIVCLQSPN